MSWLRRTGSFVAAKAQVLIQLPNQSFFHQPFDQLLGFGIEPLHQRLTDWMLEALRSDTLKLGGQGLP